MSKHFDKLSTLLALLKCEFSFIGISETRSTLDGETVPEALEQKEDFPLQGYEKFFTPTESSVGGVSLYILNTHILNTLSSKAKARKDLDSSCYLDSKLESVFVEIERPKETNMIVGTIYRHPCMSISQFNSEYLTPLLHKVSSEKKQVLLLGDFNIDLLKCNDDHQVMSFLDILGSHLVAPQILLPTRITEHSKTLIDNILSSPTESGTISGNLIYAISDHLPQFCLFPSLDLGRAKGDGPHYQKTWSSFNA